MHALQECSLCFPQSCQSPTVKSYQPSKSDSLGIPIPCPIAGPPGWEAWRGASLQWVDLYGIIVLQFVSHPPSDHGIWFYCYCAPPTLSLQLLPCPWMWGIFFGDFQCPVEECSAVSCDSGALARRSLPPLFFKLLSSLNLSVPWLQGHFHMSVCVGHMCGMWSEPWHYLSTCVFTRKMNSFFGDEQTLWDYGLTPQIGRFAIFPSGICYRLKNLR